MDIILSRRSIRKYTSQPVSDELIKEILKAAMAAPSAGNEQPWHFIVIKDRAILDEIPKIHQYTHMLKEAPAAILVCGDERLERFKGFWVQDCSAATQNILLACQAKGLGSVWCGIYPVAERVQAFQKLLGIPAEVKPFSLVALGYPAEEKEPANRYNEERVHYNKW